MNLIVSTICAIFYYFMIVLLYFLPLLPLVSLPLTSLFLCTDILPLSVTVVEASGMESLTEQLSSMTTEEGVSSIDMTALTQRVHNNCLVDNSSEQAQTSSELGVTRDSEGDRCQQVQSMDNDECALHQRTSFAPHSPFS